MNRYTLYINDTLADLKQGTTIATTIQRVDFGLLSTRKVNRTNRIELPPTETNNLIFGVATSEKSTSIKPYSVLPCKLTINGYDVFPDGVCYLIEYDSDKGYSVSILENVYDVFLNIKGKNISYVNPIGISSWSGAGRDAARTNTSGIISAVLNWGRGIYDANFFLPCFYYHTIVTTILESTGLTLEGNILTDTDFTGLVIPFAGDKFEYNPALIDSIATSSEDPDGDVFIFPATGDSISFTQYANEINNILWDFTPPGKFVNTTVYTLPVTFTSEVRVDNVIYDILDVSIGFRFNIIKNSAGVETTVGTSNTINYPTTSGILSGSITTTSTVMLPGDQLYLEWEMFGAANGVAEIETFTHEAQTGFDSDVALTSVIWNLLWPEIKMDDIMTDFNNRFAIIYKQIGDRLILKTLEEICQDKAGAIDWSSNRVNKESKKITFKSGYAQESQFNYEDNIENKEIGRGIITIPNTILDPVKTIFTSPAGNTQTETTGSYTKAALIPAYDADSASLTDIVEGPGFRVLTLKERTTENSITFDAVPRTDFKIAYFIDATQVKDTGFQYFLNKYYPSLNIALQRYKIVTFEYNLSEVDIQNYDPHKMIYDDGSYYLVNKISNYVPGRIVQVELFKIL